MDDASSKGPAAEADKQGELDQAAATVEAILFASDGPLTAEKIAGAAELPRALTVRKAIRVLNVRYEQTGSAYRIEEIAGGYQMFTLPQYHAALSRLQAKRQETRLSQAALETLAIVAYRQPVLRADIEAIRGVACGEVLRGLLDKQLVKIVGRADVLGRPMLYGTTRRFLEVFGLSSSKDLPRAEELRQPLSERAASEPKPQEGEGGESAAESSPEGSTVEPPAEPPAEPPERPSEDVPEGAS